MNRELLWNRKLESRLQSAALLGAMALLLAFLGHMVFGQPGVLMALFVGLTTLVLGSGLSPRWVMRLNRARPLLPHEAPTLLATVRELARRAELPSPPALYYVPSAQLNAFAVGQADDSAIGVTDGLLRRLDRPELAGVLAHEISHVKNQDLRIMGLAAVLTRMTRTLSLLGPVLLLLTVPLALLGQARVPWLAILLLTVAPTLSGLMQLALSRTREFDADLDAARLTGDPAGLASALTKLEAPSGGWLWQLLTGARRQRPEESSLLRTHPTTRERVRRLSALLGRPSPGWPVGPQRVPVSRRVPVRRGYPPSWRVVPLV